MLVKARSSVSSSDIVGMGVDWGMIVTFSVGMGVFRVWIDTLIFFLVGDGVICTVGDMVVISFSIGFGVGLIVGLFVGIALEAFGSPFVGTYEMVGYHVEVG